MQSLESFQRSFVEMLNGAAVPCFQSTSALTSEMSQSIHRSSYKNNLKAALSVTYKNVLTLVGERYFSQLVFQFIKFYPSRTGDLNDYGADFPTFLEEHLPHLPAGRSLPYLADVARLDWAIERAQLAKNSRSDALKELLTLSDQSLGAVTMNLNSGFSIVSSEYPLRAMCSLHTAEQGCSLDQGGEVLAINKVGHELIIRSIPVYLADFLAFWRAHLFLGTALEQFHALHPKVSISVLFMELNDLAAVNTLEVWG
jgi:hypothetical protein